MTFQRKKLILPESGTFAVSPNKKEKKKEKENNNLYNQYYKNNYVLINILLKFDYNLIIIRERAHLKLSRVCNMKSPLSLSVIILF